MRNNSENVSYLDFRPCLDLRKTNEEVKKLIFYNPPIKEILEEITKFTVSENGKLERASYFTGIDLKQAFMQVKIQKASKVLSVQMDRSSSSLVWHIATESPQGFSAQ